MSVNNLLDSGNVAESWKDLRLSKLTLDSELVLSPSAQNIMSLDIINETIFNSASQDLNFSQLVNSNPEDISPIGITYTGGLGTFINVAITGYYLVDFQLVAYNNAYTADTNLSVILWNDNSGYGITSDEIRVIDNGGKNNTASFSRVVKLFEGIDYKILINSSVAQPFHVTGGGASYISIIKQF